MRWERSVIAAGRLEHPLARSCSARVNALSFGRKAAVGAHPRSPLLSGNDVRLFLTTFAAGFIFVGVLIA